MNLIGGRVELRSSITAELAAHLQEVGYFDGSEVHRRLTDAWKGPEGKTQELKYSLGQIWMRMRLQPQISDGIATALGDPISKQKPASPGRQDGDRGEIQ